MITINRLAKLFGISEQTIRMYEKYGLVKVDRNEISRYRKFDLNAFTCLIKTRILQGYGFSMKDICALMDNASFEITIESFENQSKKIEREIELLAQKKRALERLTAEVVEIKRKQNTCEMVWGKEYYLYPALEDNTIVLQPEQKFLTLWNEYAFARQDINLIDLNREEENKIFYGIEKTDADLYGFDPIHTIHIPAQKSIKAYFIRSSDYKGTYKEELAFALMYAKENGLELLGQMLIFLPFCSGTNPGNYYHYALIPVK